jgi:hypothetical protein
MALKTGISPLIFASFHNEAQIMDIKVKKMTEKLCYRSLLRPLWGLNWFEHTTTILILLPRMRNIHS